MSRSNGTCSTLALALLAPALALLTPAFSAEAVVLDRALVLDGTVTSGAASIEASEAAAMGLEVDVVGAATWSAMTAEDFATYRLLILGDPTCYGPGLNTDAAAAAANATTWGPVINGNVVIVGTDPVYHASQGGQTLTRRAVDFALAQSGKTGAYITLSCYYHDSPEGAPVTLLDGIGGGGFTVTGVGCYNSAHIVASHPALDGLSDADLSNWTCSVHEGFQTWPGSLVPLAIAKDFDSAYTASDGTKGPPYILAGGDIRSFPLSLSPLDANGGPGATHTVTAELLDGSTRSPIAGALIGFEVASGPNAAASGACIPGDCRTDSNGTVAWTYPSGLGKGRDTILAYFDEDDSGSRDPGEPRTTASINWVGETCTNAIDDDGDTLVDCDDPGCLVCGDGDAACGEQCDDDNTASGDCCSPGCTIESAGTECRAARGICDSAESCDGMVPDCPIDVVSSFGTDCSASADGNPCTDDVCDGAGNCGTANTAPCDDGLFCNGDDVCAAGVCTHDNPPCGVPECASCDEGTHVCSYASSETLCQPDEDECTNDRCNGTGSCGHPPIPVASSCQWAVLGGSDTRQGSIRTRTESAIHGSLCADRGEAGGASQLLGDGSSWALLEPSGTAMRARNEATIYRGSVVTGGGCVTGFDGLPIFGTVAGPVCCADGDIVLPGGGATNVINACGSNPLVAECASAKALVASDVAALDALLATQSLGPISVPFATIFDVTGGPGLNVIDIDRLKIARDATLRIDAQGNPDAVFVLRIASGLRTSERTFPTKPPTIELAGGATAENVLFYVASGSCTLGLVNLGSGTVFCPDGKLKVRRETHWKGAFVAGSSVDVGIQVELSHAPFLGLAD